MIRFDCKKCGENVFDVVDVEHLGTMPHEWTCSGCGRVYCAELVEGILIVYQSGYKRSAKVYEKEIEPEPVPGPDTGDEIEQVPRDPGEELESEPDPELAVSDPENAGEETS